VQHAVTLLILLIGYWQLQIGQHRNYVDLAERNRVRNLPVIAPRGRILDREGHVLVDNFRPSACCWLRESAGTLSRVHVEGIARGLQIDSAEFRHPLNARLIFLAFNLWCSTIGDTRGCSLRGVSPVEYPSST